MTTDISTLTPLTKAIIEQNNELINQILDQDPDIREGDDQAFCVAVIMNNEPIARRLLEQGSNVNAIPNYQLATYLETHDIPSEDLFWTPSRLLGNFANIWHGTKFNNRESLPTLKGFLFYATIMIKPIDNNPILDLLLEYDIDTTSCDGYSFLGIILSWAHHFTEQKKERFMIIIIDLIQNNRLNKSNIEYLFLRTLLYQPTWSELLNLFEDCFDTQMIESVMNTIIVYIVDNNAQLKNSVRLFRYCMSKFYPDK